MSIRSLTGALAIVLTTACASLHQMPVPNWERYQQGELAGFVHAPGEHVVNEIPGVTVRRARGVVAFPGEDPTGRPAKKIKPNPANHTPTDGGEILEDLSRVDTTVFVVELRGPGSSRQVRSMATRSGVFDFGPMPKGTYTLKATVPGWRSVIRTVTVSDSADAAEQIGVVLSR
jgi:hypothetical protein